MGNTRVKGGEEQKNGKCLRNGRGKAMETEGQNYGKYHRIGDESRRAEHWEIRDEWEGKAMEIEGQNNGKCLRNVRLGGWKS